MSEASYKLVLLRHGESLWNVENRFTGWTDVDLSEKGKADARHAGEILKEEGYTFDVAHTSLLKRALRTLWQATDAMDLLWIPVHKTWRLNERHYGTLQGLNKSEMAEKYGEDQVKQWRRAYSVRPPLMESDNPLHPSHDPRYADVPAGELPGGEALEDTVGRVLPYWEQSIAPQVREGKRVLIVAHGNSLRALVKYLDDMSEEAVTELNIPVGIPLVYELDEHLKPLRHYYLGNQEEIAAQIEATANQGKVTPH